MVGHDDLKGLFQQKEFCDSLLETILAKVEEIVDAY